MNDVAQIHAAHVEDLERVQRLALCLLRTGARSRLYSRDLADVAGCSVAHAREALAFLQATGLLSSELVTTPNGEPANRMQRRYYSLTELGRQAGAA